MAKSKKANKQPFTFKHTFVVSVSFPEFQLASSLEYLDASQLSQAANASFDVGFFKTNCGERHVLATIEAGRVTKLNMEPCGHTLVLGPQLAALVNAALKRAGKRPGKWKPVPVKEFLADAKAIAEKATHLGTICIWPGACIHCIWSDTTRACTWGDIGINIPAE